VGAVTAPRGVASARRSRRRSRAAAFAAFQAELGTGVASSERCGAGSASVTKEWNWPIGGRAGGWRAADKEGTSAPASGIRYCLPKGPALP
jgi:hypothetical protein